MAVANRHKSFPLLTPTNNRFLAFKWDRNRVILSEFNEVLELFRLVAILNLSFQLSAYAKVDAASGERKRQVCLRAKPLEKTELTSFRKKFIIVKKFFWISGLWNLIIVPIFYRKANKIDWQTLTLQILLIQ